MFNWDQPKRSKDVSEWLPECDLQIEVDFAKNKRLPKSPLRMLFYTKRVCFLYLVKMEEKCLSGVVAVSQ